MPKHTPDQLGLAGAEHGVQVCDSERDLLVAQIIHGYDLPPEEVEATGERICACYNACAGINPDAVPGLVAACERALRRIMYLQGQLEATGWHLTPEGRESNLGTKATLAVLRGALDEAGA